MLPILPLRSSRCAATALFSILFALGAPAFADTAPPIPLPTSAAIPKVPIGFSKLLVRLEGKDAIGIAGLDYHVRILERMRAQGFQAVGAENLVFGRDESSRAAYILGGTVRDVECQSPGGSLNCRMKVEWQVLDVERDEVVYTVMSSATVFNKTSEEKEQIAGLLLDGAVDSLLKRPAFRHVLVPRADLPALHAPAFPAATIPSCAPGRKVAESADNLMREVVVVREAGGHGSGFFVSPEGLVLTAAHVVKSPNLTLRLRDGTEVDAVPVRVDTREDVALLRPVKPLPAQPCMVLRVDTPSSGMEAYAVGAPEHLELAFSLTRGIVSGVPILDGHRRLQTDASVSPGNSGGPIVDANGAAMGIVSFKLTASHAEGVAFAVPMREALAALGLQVGAATAPALLTTTADLTAHPSAALQDVPDPVISVDPEGDRQRAAAAEAARLRKEDEAAEVDRDRRTPVYVPLMKWGGLTAAAIGGIAIATTYLQYDPTKTTMAQFSTLRDWNTAGWVALGAGTASFALSFVFRPAKHAPAAAGDVSFGVGLGGVECKGAF